MAIVANSWQNPSDVLHGRIAVLCNDDDASQRLISSKGRGESKQNVIDET